KRQTTMVATSATAKTIHSTRLSRCFSSDSGFLLARAILVVRPQPFQQLFAALPHASRTQREHQVSFLSSCQASFHAAIQRSHVLYAAMSELADTLDERFGAHPFDRLLRGRIDIHDENVVRLVKGAGKLVHQVERPGVPVRLKQDEDP